MRQGVGPGMSGLAPDPINKRLTRKLAKPNSHMQAFLSLMGCLSPNCLEKKLENASSGNPRIQPLVAGKNKVHFFYPKTLYQLIFFTKNT